MSFTCWKYSRSTSSMSRRPLVSWKRHIRDKRAHTGVNTQAAQLMQLPRYTTGLHHTSSCSRVDARTRNSARLTTSVCVSVSMSVCTPAALSQAGALCTRLHPQEAARMPRLLHATWHTVLPARESLASKGRQRIMAACVETRHTAAVRRFCFVVLLFFFFLFFFWFRYWCAHVSVSLRSCWYSHPPPRGRECWDELFPTGSYPLAHLLVLWRAEPSACLCAARGFLQLSIAVPFRSRTPPLPSRRWTPGLGFAPSVTRVVVETTTSLTTGQGCPS